MNVNAMLLELKHFTRKTRTHSTSYSKT